MTPSSFQNEIQAEYFHGKTYFDLSLKIFWIVQNFFFLVHKLHITTFAEAAVYRFFLK